MAHITQKISPYLWFDNQAKEAAEFYCAIFNNSQILSASDLIIEFELERMRFMALNGGPRYKFNEAISFMVYCENQEEVDHFWHHFVDDGGKEDMCAWCKDKYGLSWQIVPTRFIEMMKTGTPEQVQRVTAAMLKMKKLVITDLEEAFNP